MPNDLDQYPWKRTNLLPMNVRDEFAQMAEYLKYQLEDSKQKMAHEASLNETRIMPSHSLF